MTLSGEYSETTGYTPALTDHYFLTEPSEFLYTHYPSTGSSIEYTYSKDWQLVTTPISLAKCGNIFIKSTLKIVQTSPLLAGLTRCRSSGLSSSLLAAASRPR